MTWTKVDFLLVFTRDKKVTWNAEPVDNDIIQAKKFRYYIFKHSSPIYYIQNLLNLIHRLFDLSESHTAHMNSNKNFIKFKNHDVNNISIVK